MTISPNGGVVDPRVALNMKSPSPESYRANQQIKNEMKLWHSATYLSVLSYEHDHARDMQKMMDANHTESAKWPGYDWAYKVNVTRLSSLVQTCIDSVVWRRLWRVSPTDTRFTVPHTGR